MSSVSIQTRAIGSESAGSIARQPSESQRLFKTVSIAVIFSRLMPKLCLGGILVDDIAVLLESVRSRWLAVSVMFLIASIG